jgi:DNA-binding NarL/FixJ family response regulator
MPINRPRVLIADAHTLIAELCSKLLETDFNVVGTATDGHTMVQLALQLRPDLIVVDIAMPILNGLDAGWQVKKVLPETKLIFLTILDGPELVAEAFRRGASGYLLKTCTASELLTGVQQVLRGKSYVSKILCKDEVSYIRCGKTKFAQPDERLTDRQRQVLQLLAEGKVMKEVGFILNLTTRTVSFHKYRIMKALGVTSSAELIRYAIKNYMV